MKRINLFMILAAAALMMGFGPNEEKTVLVGHFLNTADVPEFVTLFDDDTEEVVASVPVKDGTFRYDVTSDKTTIMSLRFGKDGNEWRESFVPTGDTVRYEIDGLKTVAEVFSPETSLNFPTRDFAAFCKNALPRLKTDSTTTSELRDYCIRMIDEHPSDVLGYTALIHAPFANLLGDEWKALLNKMSPEIQAKPRVKAMKAWIDDFPKE